MERDEHQFSDIAPLCWQLVEGSESIPKWASHDVSVWLYEFTQKAPGNWWDEV